MTTASALGITSKREEQLNKIFQLAANTTPPEFRGYELHRTLIASAATPVEAYYLALLASIYLRKLREIEEPEPIYISLS